jgi:hypothetical protein
MTLGVGWWKDNTFESILADLQEARIIYSIPDDATVVRAPVGSVYALEIIWIERDSGNVS